MSLSRTFYALMLLALAALTTRAHSQISLDWKTSEGGSYTLSSADGIELESTIIQSGAADMSDGDTVMQMGFWAVEAAPPPCPADFNRDGGIDGADVQAFFEAWEQSEAASDVNFDGGIDGADVQYFFEVWELGSC